MIVRTTLIASTTATGASDAFDLEAWDAATITTDADLAGSETVDVQITDDGSTFRDYTDGDGTVQLSATKNSIRIVGPATYKIQKNTTTGATAVVRITSE